MSVTITNGTTTNATIENLKTYIREELEKNPIRESVERMARDGSSTAGGHHEAVFQREFLCPAIGSFF